MQTYIGTKLLNARPMTLGEYNDYRGWTLPDDEDGNDPGYLVEYLDGGAPNHPNHSRYISWSPEDVFERAYSSLGRDVSEEPEYMQRLLGELAELEQREKKLSVFLDTERFVQLPEKQQTLLHAQREFMRGYISILRLRTQT